MLVKMFATLVLLTTLATCYGLTLSDSLLSQSRGNPVQSAISSSEFKGNTLGGSFNETLSPDESLVTTFRAPSLIKNVTAQNALDLALSEKATSTNGCQSVLLHCLVEPSSELAVSWFRGTGELQLLTYGPSTIIQDERFVVRHGLVKEDDWALQIKNLDKSDAGLYQCQTNSDPVQSQYYQLNVVEPQVNILGAPDMAVKVGNAINLTCVISQSADQLQFVFWYRDNRMINYDMNERGKIVMSKGGGGGSGLGKKEDTITSNLQIFSSIQSDSGNYTCLPSGARPVSIHVHVLEGLDKRLIMFQNDYVDPTASSQQTNSATTISVHITRLSQGRVYAFLVTALIFTTWFQLVAQAQTLISLFLLAIIGFFIGKVTDQQNQNQHQNQKEQPPVYELSEKKIMLKIMENNNNKEEEVEDHDDTTLTSKSSADESLKTNMTTTTAMTNHFSILAKSRRRSSSSPSSDVKRRRKRKQQDKKVANNKLLVYSDSLEDNVSQQTNIAHDNNADTTLDPLIRRANSALNLLKALQTSSSAANSSSSSSSSCCDEQSLLSPNLIAHPTTTPTPTTPESSTSTSATTTTTTTTTTTQRDNNQPLTSPSNSCSSNSTGYNSDSRSTNPTRTTTPANSFSNTGINK